jgi:hypothetical protein
MVEISKLYESFYRILTNILPYKSNKRSDSYQIFYKKLTGILDYLMRIKRCFWAKILQKKKFNPVPILTASLKTKTQRKSAG